MVRLNLLISTRYCVTHVLISTATVLVVFFTLSYTTLVSMRKGTLYSFSNSCKVCDFEIALASVLWKNSSLTSPYKKFTRTIIKSLYPGHFRSIQARAIRAFLSFLNHFRVRLHITTRGAFFFCLQCIVLFFGSNPCQVLFIKNHI